jgi:hypothetical protein
MPIALSFEEPSTFVACGSGTVTLHEAQEMVARILEDERLGPGTALLGDIRALERAMPVSDVRFVATLFPRLTERGLGRVAIVADRSSIYGVARMFSAFAAMLRVDVCAFRQIEEAQAWLDAEEAVRGS